MSIWAAGDWFTQLTMLINLAVIVVCFSLLFYKPTRVFSVVSVATVGLGMAYLVVANSRVAWQTCIVPLLEGEYLNIIPLFLSALAFTVFIKPLRFLVRWTYAVLSGLTIGLLIRSVPQASIILQLEAISVNLTAGSAQLILQNVLVIIGVICIMTYFTFTRKHTGTYGAIAKVGRWFLISGLGVSLGYYFMGGGIRAIYILLTVLQYLGIA